MNKSVPSHQNHLLRSRLLPFILFLVIAGMLSVPQAVRSAKTDDILIYLPLIFRSPSTISEAITRTDITLPHPLGYSGGSWCTWGYCGLSPRLYHEPISDGRIFVGWTDSSGNGHVSLLSSSGILSQTFDFSTLSVRGLAAEDDGRFAVLLWDAVGKNMTLSRYEANGSLIWRTNINDPLTIFDQGIGDSRLTYGNNTYAAYFAVYGTSGWVQGHNGDQLTYVDLSGKIQSGGWQWGCSHSMAELISYHPGLALFMPVCSSDCYASKGILIKDSKVVYACDGNCGGLVSAQLGQATLAQNGWKLVFNALNRPAAAGKGIGLASIDQNFASSTIWLTNTSGDFEREPVIARLGASLASDRYLVGWKTADNNTYWLSVINGSGAFIKGPDSVSSNGIAWGDRDDSLRTHADGSISWVAGNPSQTTLTLFRFNSAAYLP